MPLMQGSAICGDTSWVPCPECDLKDWENEGGVDRFGGKFL